MRFLPFFFIIVGVPESTVRCPLCQIIISPGDEATWKQHLMEDGGCPKNKKSLPATAQRSQMTSRSNTLQSSTSSSTATSTVSSPVSRSTGRSASVSRSHSSAFVANSSPVSPSGSGPLDIPEYISHSRSAPTSSAAPEGTSLYSPSNHHYTHTTGPDSGSLGSYPPRFIDQDSVHPLDPVCPPIVVPNGPSSLSSSSSSSSSSIPHSATSHQIGRGASNSISTSGTSNSSRIPKLGTARSVSSNSCKLSPYSLAFLLPFFLFKRFCSSTNHHLFDLFISSSNNSGWLSLEVVYILIKFLPSPLPKKKWSPELLWIIKVCIGYPKGRKKSCGSRKGPK